tara:strand:- start:1467 stop:1607 length:141 start_codon:yes stop_codon:yes gene_type:complete
VLGSQYIPSDTEKEAKTLATSEDKYESKNANAELTKKKRHMEHERR